MPKTILIVDDYAEYSQLLAKKLAGEGFQAVVSNDGGEAIQKAKTLKPDLIILDIMMPNVGGPEVRIELMKDLDTKSIPLIFLTGLRPPHSKKDSSAGVKVIGKSNDINELLEAIREIFADAGRS